METRHGGFMGLFVRGLAFITGSTRCDLDVDQLFDAASTCNRPSAERRRMTGAAERRIDDHVRLTFERAHEDVESDLYPDRGDPGACNLHKVSLDRHQSVVISPSPSPCC
jgi:hypothetical protein